jgi:histidinol-phosphatase (PHP family)
MIPITNHVHSIFSDGHDTVQDMVKAAKEAGIKIMTMTDHFQSSSIYKNSPFKKTLRPETLDAYFKEIGSLKSDGIKVLKGIEIEYVSQYESGIKEALKNPELDFALCSVHYIDWISFDGSGDEMEKNVKVHGGIRNLYSLYYEELKKAISSGLFDCFAHFDLIKIYNKGNKYFSEEEEEYRNHVEECLQLMKKNNCAIELNVRGFKKPIGIQYPSMDILKRCNELGIDVSLGSDAHRKEEIALHMEKGDDILKEAGYTRVVYFEKRKKKYLDI